jgi:transcriptional regulator NrdR family protein
LVIANGLLVPVTELELFKCKLGEVVLDVFRQLSKCGYIRFRVMTGHFAARLSETIPF